MQKKLFVTDFDGTLATHDGRVSQGNLRALERLAERGIVRAIATGRNLYSIRKVIPSNFPIDYVIFTTGAGLIHWPTQKIILSHHLDRTLIDQIFSCFKEHAIDFMIHDPIPNNHVFCFFETGALNVDFETRKRHYEGYSQLGSSHLLPNLATQFLGVLRPDQDESLYSSLKSYLENLNVVRATSPFDQKSIWIEVFAKKAAKDSTSDYLARSLGFTKAQTVAVGNDYNDEDLLNWAGKAFVVANAIENLKANHEMVADVAKDGFAEAVEKVLS